jgi:integrase
MDEWNNYFNYKTKTRPANLRRHKNGRWSLSHPGKTSVISNAVNTKNGMVCATAQICWGQFSSFFGFLTLSESLGGYGLPTDTQISMAWLAVPEAIDAYLEFCTRRSMNIKHGGQKKFGSEISKLTNPITGYLYQQPEFEMKLPDSAKVSRGWQEMCTEAHEIAKEWISDSKGKSRDPKSDLSYFLSQPYPLEPIFRVMKKLREEANCAPRGSTDEAIARRDELILAMLIANPLRAKNLMTMEYSDTNTGELTKAADGRWRVSISGQLFKNKSRVGNQKYDVPLPKWVSDLVSDYVLYYRPVFIRDIKDPGYLFLSRVGGGRFDHFGRRVFVVTRRYLPESGGISPHGFRHLVATDWLTKYPNDFITVAELLNDTIEVVMASYVHLKKEVSFARYEDHVCQMMSI